MVDNGVETLAVSFPHVGKRYIPVNIYISGNAVKTEAEWENTVTHLLCLGERVVVPGEFNVRSPFWCDIDFNTNGEALNEAYMWRKQLVTRTLVLMSH